MKRQPIPLHTHSIVLTFTNMTNKLVCFRFTMPKNDKKFSISEWYKKLKVVLANQENVPVSMIKGKHEIIECQNNRTTFEWAGGICLDMPADSTNYDYEIVKAQLKVLMMAAR